MKTHFNFAELNIWAFLAASVLNILIVAAHELVLFSAYGALLAGWQ